MASPHLKTIWVSLQKPSPEQIMIWLLSNKFGVWFLEFNKSTPSVVLFAGPLSLSMFWDLSLQLHLSIVYSFNCLKFFHSLILPYFVFHSSVNFLKIWVVYNRLLLWIKMLLTFFSKKIKKSLWMWPYPSLNHFVRLPSMTQGTQAYKDTPIRQNITRAQRSPPRNRANARYSLWAKFFTTWPCWGKSWEQNKKM